MCSRGRVRVSERAKHSIEKFAKWKKSPNERERGKEEKEKGPGVGGEKGIKKALSGRT